MLLKERVNGKVIDDNLESDLEFILNLEGLWTWPKNLNICVEFG